MHKDFPNGIYEIIVPSSEQIKSADPVTYDDNGKVIPLSERFNPKRKDIRFSVAPDRNDPLDTARRIAAEDRWEKGKRKTYDPANPKDRKALFSVAPQGNYDDMVGSNQRRRYEDAIKVGRFVWHEAWVDAAKSLEELQKALTNKKSDFELLDAHNAYRKLLHLTSVVDAEQKKVDRTRVKPLQDAVDKAMRSLSEAGKGDDRKELWRQVHDYVWMKSGLPSI